VRRNLLAMSNPMLAGLGSLLKPGDKRFELPPIKDPSGKGAGYAPKAPPEVEKAREETAKAADNNEGGPSAEKEMDISIGLLLGMAATCVTAHGEKEFGETAAYFWREASNDMRLKNNPRDEKWADWATDNAQKLDVIVTKERVKPKKKKEPVLVSLDSPFASIKSIMHDPYSERNSLCMFLGSGCGAREVRYHS